MAGLYTFVMQWMPWTMLPRGDADIAVAPLMGNCLRIVSTRIFSAGRASSILEREVRQTL